MNAATQISTPLDPATLEDATEPTIVWATITGRDARYEQTVTWRGLVLVDEGQACRADREQVGAWTWHPLTALSGVYPVGPDPKPAGGAA